MAVAANLFYDSNDSEKQTLYSRSSPTDEQFDEQQERWNLLADHLRAELKEMSGYDVSTWLQGSYKFGTQIRPVRKYEEFDIDLGVYFEWAGNRDAGDYSPQDLRDFVQSSLKNYAKSNTDDVKAVAPKKTRCCRIRYKNNFHIDVPVYHLNPNKDKRSLATDSGWEDSDPKAIYLWFRDYLDESIRPKVRRQIQYLKAWVALKFKENSRPSSILLTVLVAQAVNSIGAANVGPEDELMRDVLNKISARLAKSSEVDNPVDSSENLNRMEDEDFADFTGKLATFAQSAQSACSTNNYITAIDKWQQEFEYLFPMPDVDEELVESSINLPTKVFFPEIEVTATSKINRALRYHDINRIGPIPKGCDILFRITNSHELPPYATVQWTVRNEGREAENLNDLGHHQIGAFSAQEESAYMGTHYMDCVVRVGGQTVGIRRVEVIISGTPAVRRNPLKKPHWTKLNRR